MNNDFDKLSFGIQYLLTERLCANLLVNDNNSYVGKLISVLKAKTNVEIELLEFYSFYREVAFLKVNEANYLFWDNAYFTLINNFIKISFISDTEKAKKMYNDFIILIFLEKSIIEKSYLTNGFFYDFLESGDILLARKILDEDIEDGLIAKLMLHIETFSYAHELSHLVYDETDESYNFIIEHYLKIVTMDNDTIRLEAENQIEKDNFLNLSKTWQTNSSLKEELISDYEAILFVSNFCADEEDVWLVYLSQLYLFKIMSTISNVKTFINTNQFNEFRENYIEQRLRLDFRCTIFMEIVYKKIFKCNETEYSKANINYKKKYQPFIDRFEKIRMTVESNIFSYEFLNKIHQNSISENIKFQNSQILKILGWI